ncbi:uncharacterized protein METZ01_LOCUS474308, partial [marine metagenome]
FRFMSQQWGASSTLAAGTTCLGNKLSPISLFKNY